MQLSLVLLGSATLLASAVQLAGAASLSNVQLAPRRDTVIISSPITGESLSVRRSTPAQGRH